MLTAWAGHVRCLPVRPHDRHGSGSVRHRGFRWWAGSGAPQVSTGPIRLDTPRFRYIPALDGIRGIGVLIVMFYHYGGIIWLHGGPIMVDLFFVLSSFLITNLVLDEKNRSGTIGLRGFYHRRILRLFPALYALLAVVAGAAAVAALAGSDALSTIWGEIVAIMLYVYNFFLAAFGLGSPDEPRFLLHLWTLSMEEWFYLIWPFLMIVGLRKVRNQRILIAASGVFIAFWMSVRLGAGLAGYTLNDADAIEHLSEPVKFLLRFSIMRPDSLVVGSLAAIASRSLHPMTEAKNAMLGRIAAVCGVVVFAVLLGGGRLSILDPFASIGYNLGILALAPVIIWLHFNPTHAVSRALSAPIWLWLGTRSYGIYIWHEIPNPLIPRFGYGKAALIARAAVLMAISIGIAELSWRFVETPFLKRKSKKYNSVSGR